MIKEFSAERELALDDFQIDSCQAILDGLSVLVAAPTGSGKTIVADFSAYLALKNKTKVIYTTPIKALSNQKYLDFVGLYGKENVGLATGDRSINPRASITIMTTEVLRNMIYTDIDALKNVSHVILDEVHYISDRTRGAVWEEIIIQLPFEIDLVCLSATVSNAEEVGDWLTTVRGATKVIIHEIRPVPLTYWYGFRIKRQGLTVLPLLNENNGYSGVHPDLSHILKPSNNSKTFKNILPPTRFDLIDYLEGKKWLPAIFFIFSRNGCDNAIEECSRANINLTNHEEKLYIRSICDKHLGELTDNEFDALECGQVVNSMERGIAPHHAGLIPPLREAVEEAFIAGLIKVVFATETLAVGVNMPAKTVVVEKLTKFNGMHHDIMTPGEFTQLTGRAGRRGIDKFGNTIVCWNRFVDYEQAASLASTRSYALKSLFRPTYNMAMNLIKNYTPANARHILNLSLAQFQSDDAIVALERTLSLKKRQQEEIRKVFNCTDRQFDAKIYKATLRKKQNDKQTSSKKSNYSIFSNVQAGDIIDSYRHGGACVVISKAENRQHSTIRVVDLNARVQLLTPEHFEGEVNIIGNVQLPVPLAPRTKHFRLSTSILLRKYLKHSGKNPKKNSSSSNPKKIIDEEKQLIHYSLLEADIKKLTKRVQSRGQSLARQLERILTLLETYEFVEDWTLTKRGIVLSGINAEADVVIAYLISSGALDTLTVPELTCILVSFVFESRSRDDASKSSMTQQTSIIFKDAEDFLKRLNQDEREAGLNETRGPDYAMVKSAYSWAQGKALLGILERSELTGGDFVRAMKSVLDLCRQISNVAPTKELKDLCDDTIDICFRDIVKISS